ncbi:tyrosine-protein phosphatase [Flavobacterium aestivum]|uniref:tyrosine-protein phosphatase n=1 Tax=Flavobacterium aestivum TaxID=3003257 RepID=UPI0024823163|nr:tyrosine-protein phosphatase [Flavobacterium aestivum]
MKKNLQKLFYVALLGFATFSNSSCSNNDEETVTVPYATDENLVALKGEDNMRDLGGYVGADSKRILYHKLFRSGELSTLTAADLEHLTSKEIYQIIDLRTTTERTEKPDVTIKGTVHYELSLLDESNSLTSGGATSSNSVMGLILSGKVKAEEIMIPAYAVDDIKIAQWTKIFDLLESGQTTLWHCTAGKDRAGMTSALVLYSLGVDKKVIIEDFMKSNDYLATSNNQTIAYINAQYGVAGMGEKLIPLLGVKEVYITTFLNEIETKYGSVDNFLTKIIKVDTAKMRQNFLEK